MITSGWFGQQRANDFHRLLSFGGGTTGTRLIPNALDHRQSTPFLVPLNDRVDGLTNTSHAFGNGVHVFLAVCGQEDLSTANFARIRMRAHHALQNLTGAR
ncbi:MAG: hypothetical protein HZB51_04540 [Chloroflexi bacterium]|nr:hypothetical protein [Chloroflexota bacterium]